MQIGRFALIKKLSVFYINKVLKFILVKINVTQHFFTFFDVSILVDFCWKEVVDSGTRDPILSTDESKHQND